MATTAVGLITRLGRLSRMSFVVRQAGQGAAYDFGGARFVVKASGAETGGQLAVMEVLSPAGLEVPPHVHDGEDE